MPRWLPKKSPPGREGVKKLNLSILAQHGSKAMAENAGGAHVPPGGAGAPAHALCRKERIVNFFTAPLSHVGARGADGRDL